ncbi:MAG: DUF2357 domain-containing protein [Deltaproteobacteria bacterium]|nr:DUF2357 domain-containing protein [Deltaproteobacteria bacterium]
MEDRLVLPLERVRRPVPSRMACALTRGQDLLDAETPRRMMDGRRHRTLDTWENRVVLSLLTQCAQRLRWLRTRLRRPAFEPVLAELEAALVRARRPARALGDLPPLQGPVDRATMVLLRRPPYRAAFEALAALGRAAVVSLRAPGLDAPLDSVPALYQSWATLRVIARVLFHAASYGWDVWQQRLVRALRGEAVVELLRDNQSVLELRRGEVTARIIPERRYHHAGSLQCLTEFEQRPDLSIERTEAEGVSVWLLDPKYKLDADDEGATRPLKSDVDKMHAYRDAIRGTNGVRAVRFAGVLYPGESVWWGDEIAALGAHPERRAALESDLDRMLGIAMA